MHYGPILFCYISHLVWSSILYLLASLSIFVLHLIVCTTTADIAFVLDSSGSIEDRVIFDWTFMKNFVKTVIEGLPVGDTTVRIAVVTFSDVASVEITLDQHSTKAEVIAAVDALPFVAGLTNVAEAFRVTREEVFRNQDDFDDIMVFISDGIPTVNIP